MISLIEIIAVIVNFGFAVFAMDPLKSMDPTTKLLIFLVGEHVALLVKFAIKHKYFGITSCLVNLKLDVLLSPTSHLGCVSYST